MLNTDMEFKRGILIIRLNGVLTKETINLFKEKLEKTIHDNGVKYVLINIKKAFFIDSDGLNVIKETYNKIVENKGKLIICGIERLLNNNYELTENLYQVGEEIAAYEIVNIWKQKQR